MRVLFRLEANERCGLGHAMRCLALAEELVLRGHACALLTFTSGKRALAAWYPIADVTDAGKTGEYEPGSGKDVDATIDLANLWRADWLVLDSYDYSIDKQRDLSRRLPTVQRLQLDDGVTPQYASDILLNHNCRLEGSERIVRDSVLQLLGPRYFLARNDLRRLHELRREPRSGVTTNQSRLLVAMGGADVENIGLAVARAVLQQLNGNSALAESLGPETPDGLVIDLACTAGQSGREEALKLSYSHPSLKVHQHPDLLQLMPGAKLAVCAGGVTSLELAALGIVPVILVTAANQTANAEALVSCGAALLAPDPAAAAAAVTRLLVDTDSLNKLASVGTTLLDCSGPSRVVDEMENMTNRVHG